MPATDRANSTETATAQVYLRALLAEETPPVPSADLGPWTPFATELARIGDLSTRRRAYDAAAKLNPGLRTLLNGAPVGDLPVAVVTATDVLRMTFPPKRWLIPDLLPAGLTLLAGRPKQGKSWITLQISRALATGGQVFGQTVPQGAGLVCALEDSYEGLQERMRAQGWPDPTDPIQYIVNLDELGGRLDGPGLAALEQRILTHNLTFVAIDTFMRAVGVSDINDMAQTTAALGGLQQLAIKHNIAIVCVHHTNKLAGDDFLDTVAGSTGLTAVADGIMVLKRRRFEQTASLYITHRRLGKERSLALTWDEATATWSYAGDAATIQRADDQRDILLAMLSLSKIGETATPQKIADVVERNRGNVYKDLAHLVGLNLVGKAGRKGAYTLTLEGHTEALALQEGDSASRNGETGKHEKPGNGETPPPVST